MATLKLVGKRANSRTTEVSDRWHEQLALDRWAIDKNSDGYERVRRSRHPKHILARVIMSLILGRPLLRTEHVHHKDGNQVGNNLDENLELTTNSAHVAEHNRKGRSLLGAAGYRKATSGAYRTPKGRWVVHFNNKYVATMDTQEEAIALYRQIVAEHENNRRRELGLI